MEKRIFYKPKLNFLPENLDMDKWLSNTKLYDFKKFSRDDCSALISGLYTAPLYNKTLRVENEGERPYYNLSSKIMYAQTKEYRRYIDLLISSNIWESDNSYQKDKKSKGYRFTEEYHNQPCKKYLNFEDGRIAEKAEEAIAEEVLDGGETKTVQKLVNTLPSIKINYNDAIERLHKEYVDGTMTTSQRNCAYCAIEKINNGEFFAKQDDYGRLHTNLTNLKKEYRNYLKVENGAKLVSIDLKNSQPFFSTLLFDSNFWENKNVGGKLNLRDINSNLSKDIKHLDSIIMFTKSVAHNVDVSMYIDLVVNGTLYEFFLQRLIDEGVKVKNRADAKKKIFMVFFSKLLHLENSKSASVFKRLFPSVYELFCLIKQKEHNTLAVLLQAIESNLFIEKVPCKYWEKTADSPIYTIHDSFLLPVENLEILKEEMIISLVESVGYMPSVEIEHLN
ncbi:hypothetical protein [Pedobacter nanyangensis]|uniref:hypothetical protein n=1 Tax=Pedobacter nanyangensis TaxID=1562389 RepID=UPI000DE268CE|nr:hypothetical protein [Pedobacter nanyangensis]